MHELAITQSMLDLVVEQAKQAGGSKVARIDLLVGEMCGFVKESVQFYFDLLSKGTIAEGASLNFTMVPATARCKVCGKIFEMKEFSWACPDCAQTSLDVIGGKELRVESIEVEDEGKGSQGHPRCQ